MEALGVGRSAVREALSSLKLLGVVEAVPGGRHYLRGVSSEMLPKVISWGLLLGEKQPLEVFETRAALEVRAAYIAARDADDATLEKLDEIVSRLSEKVTEPAQAIDDDLAFHEAIVAACGNAVMLDLWTSVRSLLRVWIVRVNEKEHQARSFMTFHGNVLAAIKARDPEGAAAAMNVLMDDSIRALALVLDEAAVAARADS
jgi:GntR family transcriptional repressor for pyruvate dehydrogenase complex